VHRIACASQDDTLTSSAEISLLDPLLLGLLITAGTIVVHGLTLRVIIAGVRRDLRLNLIGVKFSTDLMFMVVAVLFVFAAHLFEIGLWAMVFRLCGEFSSFAEAFFHSAGNYTTVGSGGPMMSMRWRLLAPLEGADGMLMFGVTTATTFAIIQRLIEKRYGESVDD